MSEKIKSISLLLGSLVLGIIIGALLMRFFVFKSFHKKHGKGPVRVIERTIERATETNPDQQEKIDELLNDLRKKFHLDRVEYIDGERQTLEEFLLGLKAVLDEDQFNNVNEELSFMREHLERSKQRHTRKAAEEKRP